jgi:peptidoglycan/xylan/chitin deacetylase (PgdA/CDA1 family)
LVGCCLVPADTRQQAGLAMAERVLSDAVLRLPADDADRFVVLTIDDAPSDLTADILALLDRHQAHATFFLHTDQIDSPERRDALARAVASGHELAHHMPRDVSAADYDLNNFEHEFGADFARAHQALSAYGAAARPYYRPPQGWYRSDLMDPTLARHGYDRPLAPLESRRRYVLASFIPWDASVGRTDTDDRSTNLRAGRRYADQLAEALFPGAIVIFHDGEDGPAGRGSRRARAETTLHSLDRFLKAARAQGYAVVPLSEGIARSAGP